MAPRRAVLIVPVLLALAGWAGAPSRTTPARECGGCHAPHFAKEGTCASCHRGDPAALRREIAHHRILTGRAAEHALSNASAVAEGRRLVERLACRRCHVVGAVGNRLATDLDLVVWKRDQPELQRSIASPVENMPRFGLDIGQIDSVIAQLLHGADSQRAEAAYRVRFSTTGARVDSVFARRCGGCHRTLTCDGPEGRGSAGPNLSGVFSGSYPATAPGSQAWTGETLDRWLENPRSVRPLAAMRPVRLERGDLDRLVEELSVTVPRSVTPRTEATGG